MFHRSIASSMAAGFTLDTTRELERRRLDPDDVYEWRSARDLAVLVAGHQSTVDGDPVAGICVQLHDVAAQHVGGARGFVSYGVGAVLVRRNDQPLYHPVAVTLSCARAGAASAIVTTITVKTANLFIVFLLIEA